MNIPKAMSTSEKIISSYSCLFLSYPQNKRFKYTSYHHHLFWRWSSHVLTDYFQASSPSCASACVGSSPASVSSCPSAGQATEEGSKTFLPPGPVPCPS